MSGGVGRTGKLLPTFHDFMDEGLLERIDQAVQKLGGAKAAGEIVGVSDEAIGRWRKGNAKPSFPGVLALCHAANFRVEWLATGEGPRDIRPTSAHAPTRTERERMGRELRGGEVLEDEGGDAVRLPLLSVEGSAGFGLIPAREEIEDYLAVSRNYLREVGINPLAAHVLRLSGHSMYPTLHDKDLVIVDTSQTNIRDEEIYALAYGETVLIKRVRPRLDGSLKIVSDNKNGHYEDDHVPASERDQLRIVGRVGGYLRYF